MSSPVCEICFQRWDFVPDRSLPYSGALKAVHPVGRCVPRATEYLPADDNGYQPVTRVCEECRQEFQQTAGRRARKVCYATECRKARTIRLREASYAGQLESVRKYRAKRKAEITQMRLMAELKRDATAA